jgi:hypothetical protein
MWFNELELLEIEYNKYREERIRSTGLYSIVESSSTKTTVKPNVTKPKITKLKASSIAGGRIA